LLIGLVALAGGGFLLSRGNKIAAPPPSAAPAPRPVPHSDAATPPTAEALPDLDGDIAMLFALDEEIARNAEILARLRSAPAVLDAPKGMTVGQTRPVELRVGVGVPPESLTRPSEPGTSKFPDRRKCRRT
jgi:hypothetical protein